MEALFAMRAFRLKRHVLDKPLILGTEIGFGRESEFLGTVSGPSRIIEGCGRIKRRRISWAPSPSPDIIGYRIYWALNCDVSYKSEHFDIDKETSLILPDDLPFFPQEAGEMEIGITALSRSGNESDIAVIGAPVDFTRPSMPSKLKIETIGEGWWW
jgi:hypothetical protein